jgi:hypothetical protein
MHISEPMTLLTDYAMGALGLWLALRLLRRARAESRIAALLWGGSLLMMALAAIAGGTWHGFHAWLPTRWPSALWQSTLLASGLGSALMLAAVVIAVCRDAPRRALLGAVAAKFLAYAWIVAAREDFLPVIVDQGSALLLVLLAALCAGRSGLAPARRWLAAAVAISLAGGLIQYARIAPHPAFNHNDLFHAVQMVAIVCLYRAGLLMRDARVPTQAPPAQVDGNGC